MTAPMPATSGVPAGYHVAFRRLDLATGEYAGCAPAGGGLGIAVPQGTFEYGGRGYEYATWIAPPGVLPFTFTELVASWAADTPAGTWIEVCVRARPHGSRAYGRWYVMARWAADASEIEPTSVPHQSDPVGYVDVDTFRAHTGRACDVWQLRVTLLRPVGTTATPILRYAGAVVSAPTPVPTRTSAPGPRAGRLLTMPWGGTSPLGAVLGYWGVAASVNGVGRYADAAARHTDGRTANRSFAVAYAAGFGLRAFVTRLRDLTEAELFLAAGIPLVLELADRRPVALAGLTADGGALVDGATHPRHRLELAWLAGSGGLVLAVHPPAAPLPPRPAEPNW